MLLPKQSEPVQRSQTPAPGNDARDKPREIEPQGDCVCNPNTHTIWCLSGRTPWDTRIPC